jgi:tyrosine ammonia-lyase
MNAWSPPISETRMQAAKSRPVIVVDRVLTLAEFGAVVSGQAALTLDVPVHTRLAVSADRLQACIDDRRIVYGITTGFGPLANREVAPESIETLQRNLIYHLATGVGKPLSWEESRALLLARLMSILQGWSGATPELAQMMVAVLNLGLAPFVPEKGTVGASGDLTPCAHMALALMGEGAFISPEGLSTPACEILSLHGLDAYRLARRDGLALVNGVSAMTGIAALNAARARAALQWSILLTVAHAEVMKGRAEAWDPVFGEARPHPGQIAALQALADAAVGSEWLDTSRAADRRFDASKDSIVERDRPAQDAYTIRCAPQVLGAVWDMLDIHDRIVETELNAASDNPIFTGDAPYALHGGNFYGQHVSFASDALFNAVVKIGILSERQIARVTDEKLNEGLPAFLQPDQPGLQSGFMGAQVTASALLAEMRTRAIPASIQSISTNGANQDVVSMGTIAARKTRDALDDLARILAIQMLCVAQAVELRERGSPLTFSKAARACCIKARQFSPFLANDRPLSAEIERLADDLLSNISPFAQS